MNLQAGSDEAITVQSRQVHPYSWRSHKHTQVCFTTISHLFIMYVLYFMEWKICNSIVNILITLLLNQINLVDIMQAHCEGLGFKKPSPLL